MNRRLQPSASSSKQPQSHGNGSQVLASSSPQQPDRNSDSLQVLTQGRVCARLGISDDTWRRWRARGITPPRVLVPGLPRWKATDIAEFEAGRRWRNSEGHAAQCGPQPVARLRGGVSR